MKVIAILDNVIGVGGAFDQALNAIMQMQRLSKNNFEFEVFTTHKSNVDQLIQLEIPVKLVKISIIDRVFREFSQNNWWQTLQARLKIISPIEKKMIRHGCDVVYFLVPSIWPTVLQKLKFIGTLMDLCHRETPEFPEVSNFNEFYRREKMFQGSIAPALVTLTDSNRLADMASKYYGVERDRFLVMPFGPSPLLDKNASAIPDVLKKYSLEADYFFYPAQFWAHKNHIRILQALILLRDKNGKKPTVVFSGKDHGNLNFIRGFIKSNQLVSQVKILGFVAHEDMSGLYKNAIAVVMPTYFGPTNLPPLEAWSMGVPLIYSAQLSEQVGGAALLVNPDSASELADAMNQSYEPEVRDRLVSAGYQKLVETRHQIVKAEMDLCILLKKYSSRRNCWQ
jgi:glycosyltransferase involved in cell wall biosynthesis